MARAFSLLTVALLGVSFVGVAGAAAQTSSSSSKCGPEVFSQDKMTYVGVPCSGESTSAAAPAPGQTAQSTGCKPEGWSTDKMSYTTAPCAAGTTYENPGWKGPKAQ
jgi:hypothetical protein